MTTHENTGNAHRPMLVLAWALSACIAAKGSYAQDLVVAYPSYSTGDSAVIEGRVTKASGAAAPTTADSKVDNLVRNVDLLSNNERANRPVTVRLGKREWPTTTDAEGYFRVAASDIGSAAGWRVVTAQAGDAVGETGLLVVPAANVHGVISDVDDTIQITEVNSKRRMLANTLLQNPLQRQVVPGVAAFYRELVAANAQLEAAPIFYLSASPRQIHGSIAAFLDLHGFPRGVLITKRVTNDATSEPLSDQFAYKTAKLVEILTRLPHVRFTFVGDDGEQDPEIFQALRARFPDRVAAIWIRRVNPDPKRPQLPQQGVLNERLARYAIPEPSTK